MKKEILILAAVAVGSMTAGFLLVLLVLGPGEPTTLPDPFADGSGTAAAVETGARSAKGAGGAATSPAGSGGQGSVEKAFGGGQGTAPPPPEPVEPPAEIPRVPVPEVPPPPAPAPAATGKVKLERGDPFIWRCWTDGGDQLDKDVCGTLPGVEALVDGNLGLIEGCVLDHAGESASGKLSLALKIDFNAGTVNCWLGNSTTVAEMEDVSACLRSRFEDVSLPPITHDHPRYIVFFTIETG